MSLRKTFIQRWVDTFANQRIIVHLCILGEHTCIVVCFNGLLRYLVPRSLVVSYSWLSLVYHPTYHFISFILRHQAPKGEYKMKYECFMTLWDEVLILVRTYLLLHFHKINCITIVSFEQRWAAINFWIIYYRKVTLFQIYQISFALISNFQKESLFCSPMTNSGWVRNFVLAKLKIQLPNFILWPLLSENPTTLLPNQIKLKIFFV